MAPSPSKPASSLPRLHVSAPLVPDACFAASDSQSHYLMSVLRAVSGDGVRLFNGRDGEWQARIEITGRKSCQFVLEHQLRPQHASPDIWLLFAPIRQARMDILLEKATELGVRCLMPVQTRRGQVNRINPERLTAQLVEASEQCERLDVPSLAPLVGLEVALAQLAGRTLFACLERDNAMPAGQAFAAATQAPAAILVGPEGGFDASERDMLHSANQTIAVSLGPRILRAETAAIAALAIWQSVAGDWRP